MAYVFNDDKSKFDLDVWEEMFLNNNPLIILKTVSIENLTISANDTTGRASIDAPNIEGFTPIGIVGYVIKSNSYGYDRIICSSKGPQIKYCNINYDRTKIEYVITSETEIASWYDCYVRFYVLLAREVI